MNKKITYLILIAGTLLFSSCQKNIDVFVPDGTTGPDTTWYATVSSSMPVAALQTSLLIEPTRDSIEISSANFTYLTTSSGIQCDFPPLCCATAAGTLVTGRVQVELFVIKKKGDMVLMNKPTTSNGNLLVSAGEIFVRLLKNGQEVNLVPGARITIRYTDLPVNTSMKLFYGEELANGQFNWTPNADTANVLGMNTQVYEITTKRLHWINVDALYDTTGITRSTVSVKLPSNYTNANTTAFVVFKDMRSVVRMNPDLPEKRFITGKMPAGKAAYIVVLSKQGNDYFMAKESITTGVNVTTNGNQPFSLTPVKTALADIKAWLATL